MKKKISAINFNFYYGKKHVLKNINLHIPEKKVTAIMGPSGCGKSTFLRSINRMNDLNPESRIQGTLLLDNEDIYCSCIEPVQLRQRVGMVFQQPNPLPKSVFDNVAFGPRMQGLTHRSVLEEIVVNSLKKAALWEEVKDELKKSGLSLSGGQQQRLCIARALALNPEVLLLDEPASALDPISSSKIEDLMGQLKEEYTIVIVTHNMQQAERCSDHTAFFYMGEMIEFGKTKELFSKPENKLTSEYIKGRWG